MSLNPRQIGVIHAVVQTGSVTGAAALLGVSQPAVSMTLRECNQIVGFPLFERRQGRMQPTRETLMMVPELEKIVSGMQRIDRLIDDLRVSSVGHVRLSVGPLLADTIVPQALASFERERIQLSLSTADAGQIVEELNEDRADLGMTLASSRSISDLVIDVGGVELVCVLHQGHPLAGRPLLTPEEIAPYPLISFCRNLPLADMIDRTFEARDLNCNVVCEVSNTSTACALVEEDVGIGLVPAIGLSRNCSPRIVARQFRPQIVATVQILFPRNRRLSLAARRLVATLRESARKVLLPLAPDSGRGQNRLAPVGAGAMPPLPAVQGS